MSAYDIAIMVGGPLVIVCGSPWVVQRAIATQDRAEANDGTDAHDHRD
jgi:hypothetical protein